MENELKRQMKIVKQIAVKKGLTVAVEFLEGFEIKQEDLKKLRKVKK